MNSTTGRKSTLAINSDASIEQQIVIANIDALDEGLQLMALLNQDTYVQGFKPAFHSTIGAHFRHVLEHYQCFFAQIDTGTINYDARQRQQALELDYKFALERLLQLNQQMASIDILLFEQSYLLDCTQVSDSIETNLVRELLFLESHTLHHYALIGAMARSAGINPADDFGVAIATRSFEQIKSDLGS